MFAQKWLSDCSKEDLFERLTTYCEQTNTPAQEDRSCPCQVHKAMRADRAEKDLGLAKATIREQGKDIEQLTKALGVAKSDLAKSHAVITSGTKAISDLSGKLKVAEAALVASGREVGEWKQVAVQLEGIADEAKAECEAAVAEVKRIKALVEQI